MQIPALALCSEGVRKAETLNNQNRVNYLGIEGSHMSYRPQRNTRHGTGRGTAKTHHEKSKLKAHKHLSADKYTTEEEQSPTVEKIVEKTLSRLQSLGNQTFAFSPFSQYFNDWVVSLKSVLLEFEANPAINIDEWFTNERSRIISSVELKLADRRREETVLGEVVRKIAEKNQLQAQKDTEYANATGRLASRRNSENKRLTRVVNELEKELDQTKQIKASVFSPFSRKAKAKKMAEVNSELDSAKKELELVDQNFQVDQKKLADEYEKENQAIIEEKQNLGKQSEDLDIDSSVDDRRGACETLTTAVKALIQKTSP